MKHPTKIHLAWLLSFSFLSASCVTVNVNFPESAVQKATDDYVRDLYRAKEKGKTPTDSKELEKKTSLFPFSNPFMSVAQAAEAEGVFKVDSDGALKIQKSLASRVDEVIEQKRQGLLGETNDGELEIHDKTKVKPLLLKKLEKLVADENHDRSALYHEVLKTNNLADARIKNIQKSFARSFQAESPSKTWVQDSDGKWAQKP